MSIMKELKQRNIRGRLQAYANWEINHFILEAMMGQLGYGTVMNGLSVSHLKIIRRQYLKL